MYEKIMFVGDVHIQNKAPSSRKETPEEYRDLILNKLRSCMTVALNNNIRNIIFLGDIFNSSINTEPSYVNKIYELFSEFKANDINLYTIVRKS